MIIRRVTRLWQALVGSGLTELEAQQAQAMLDLERESLREQIMKYNQGLAGYASLIERLKAETARLCKERQTLEPKLRARLDAGDRAGAGRHALRLEAIAERTASLAEDLTEAEATYKQLTRSREVAIAGARERIAALERSIDECKVQEALADLTELAAGLHGAIGLSDGTLERVRDRVEDRKHRAAGRTRVARDSTDTSGLHAQEAELQAAADAALARYESGDATG